jgi:uncharacterized protein DUF929
MSKRGRMARQRSERAAAERRRQQQRQRRRLLTAAAAVGTVLMLVAVMVVVKAVSGSGPAVPAAVTTALPAEVLRDLTGVPATVFDGVGAGTVDQVPRLLAGQPALTRSGRPLIVYIGAEYCPFCAAQRWGIVVALSRFGTFAGLRESRSATDDVFPGTPTVTFHGSTYTSAYLTFDAVETHSNIRSGDGYSPLEPLTAQQRRILDTYDRPPYVPADSAGAIPFVDFGNRYLMNGSSFSPNLLAGRTVPEIASVLSNPDDPLARAIIGSANAYTTVFCGLTGGQPAAVCGSAGAAAYQGHLHAT